ncbi:MAG: biotin/lipoate A/B protein ligase family protein [Saccharolobus sp.]
MLRVLLTEYPDNPYVNIGIDEALLIKGKGNILRIWRNNTSVILGILSKISDEVNLEFVEKYGIPLVRRISGGGTVFHDMGNINYTIIVDNNSEITGIDFLYGNLLKGTINAIKSLVNDDVEVYNESDIAFKGFKISGNSGYIYGNRYLLHGTLLVSSNLELMHKALIIPPKNRRKEVNMIKYKVNNLSNLINKKIGQEEIVNAFIESFAKITESEPYIDQIKQDELEFAINLAKNKYMKKEFINKFV